MGILMNAFNLFWLDIICLAVGMALLDLAITGKTYSHGRGGGRTLFASVKSMPARILFLLFAIGVFAFAITDFIHKLKL
jgi:hypothetical protein